MFRRLVADESELSGSFDSLRAATAMEPASRASSLRSTLAALQRARQGLWKYDAGRKSIDQLCAYIKILASPRPTQTVESNFAFLLPLRNWIFWKPASLLHREDERSEAVITIATLYAAVICLEPLFSSLGSSFCSAMILPHLEAAVNEADKTEAKDWSNLQISEVVMLMAFPRIVAMTYRKAGLRKSLIHQLMPLDLGGMLLKSKSNGLRVVVSPAH
jgi:hypothetical protein